MTNFIFKKFNYDTIAPKNSVVVLCAGPSIIENKDKVIQYIKDNNSIVISANYNYENYGIKSHYTYITDQMKLFENIQKINSDLIVPSKMKSGLENIKTIERILKKYNDNITVMIEKLFGSKRHNVYKVGDKHQITIYKIKKGSIKSLSNGEFPYRRLGSAGQGGILLSTVFKPKKILIVGLDGPILDGSYSSKKLFNGTKVKYGNKNKYDDAVEYIAGLLIPYVLSRNIVIETFENVNFYGLNKQKLGLKVI